MNSDVILYIPTDEEIATQEKSQTILDIAKKKEINAINLATKSLEDENIKQKKKIDTLQLALNNIQKHNKLFKEKGHKATPEEIDQITTRLQVAEEKNAALSANVKALEKTNGVLEVALASYQNDFNVADALQKLEQGSDYDKEYNKLNLQRTVEQIQLDNRYKDILFHISYLKLMVGRIYGRSLLERLSKAFFEEHKTKKDNSCTFPTQDHLDRSGNPYISSILMHLNTNCCPAFSMPRSDRYVFLCKSLSTYFHDLCKIDMILYLPYPVFSGSEIEVLKEVAMYFKIKYEIISMEGVPQPS